MKRGKGFKNLGLKFQDLNPSFVTYRVKMNNPLILLSFRFLMRNENTNVCLMGLWGSITSFTVCQVLYSVWHRVRTCTHTHAHTTTHPRCQLVSVIIAVVIVSTSPPLTLTLMSHEFSRAEHTEDKKTIHGLRQKEHQDTNLHTCQISSKR